METLDFKGVVRPMTEEDKKLWLVALESGEYFQGTGVLEREGRFCCLGVAKKVLNLKVDDESYLRVGHPVDWEPTFLPLETQRLLGALNDDGDSFAKIAAHIRKNVPCFVPETTQDSDK